MNLLTRIFRRHHGWLPAPTVRSIHQKFLRGVMLFLLVLILAPPTLFFSLTVIQRHVTGQPYSLLGVLEEMVSFGAYRYTNTLPEK